MSLCGVYPRQQLALFLVSGFSLTKVISWFRWLLFPCTTVGHGPSATSWSVFCGSTNRGTVDGHCSVASFDGVHSVAATGTLLFAADANNGRVRQIDVTSGAVTTVAPLASFVRPSVVVASSSSQYLYVVDQATANNASSVLRVINLSTGNGCVYGQYVSTTHAAASEADTAPSLPKVPKFDCTTATVVPLASLLCVVSPMGCAFCEGDVAALAGTRSATSSTTSTPSQGGCDFVSLGSITSVTAAATGNVNYPDELYITDSTADVVQHVRWSHWAFAQTSSIALTGKARR